MIEAVKIEELQERLGFGSPPIFPADWGKKELPHWKMEVDDAPIFRYIYRNSKPRRHLEFGTWEGAGVLLCLEESDATVWTLNLLDGEVRDDGTWAYGRQFLESEAVPTSANKTLSGDSHGQAQSVYYQTDALGFIGRKYLEKGLGNRVCQIYGDSREWDISNYSPGFFDTVLIDGGHDKHVVMNDTLKAMKLVRQGGMILWHDYCPDPEVNKPGSSTVGVLEAIQEQEPMLRRELSDLFWIYPSWILVGIKKRATLKSIIKRIFK